MPTPFSPRSRRRRPPARPGLAVPYAAYNSAIYLPGALAYPQPRAWRRPNLLLPFLQGYAIGMSLGGLLLLVALVAALILFPADRTNLLILGLDRRPGETTYVTRTDTMILATVYPRGAYAGLLSIPRDLYVTLPAGDLGRVNSAHFFAEAEAAGTGPAAAMATVRSNFGVDVHHYLRLDMIGFVRIVDALGGIDLDLPKPLIDYEYPTHDYGITTVEFEAGPQHLDGERALAYARIRHGSSDFQRAERQQLVIQAIFVRLLSPAAWPRLPRVIIAASEAIDTDLSAWRMLRLTPTLLRLGPAGLDRRVIEGEMVQPHTTENGGAVQLPVWEAINPVLLEMFGQ
ncbi:MAG: LCP family protein [Anaerolineales bacterium]|nr:LCP family protein [Anaerolineales bacterium]